MYIKEVNAFDSVEFDETQKEIIQNLTNNYLLNGLTHEKLVYYGILDENLNPKGATFRYKISKRLCDKFSNKIEELRSLLGKAPCAEALKYIVSPEYNYELLTNIVFPNFHTLAQMESVNYNDEQILFLFKNEILLDSYHYDFDYDKIQSLLEEYNISCSKYVFYLEYEVINKLLIHFPSCDIEEILSLATYPSNTEIINCWVPIMIKHNFTYEEIKVFLKILYNMSECQRIQVWLFLNYSTKQELFKKIIEMNIV